MHNCTGKHLLSAQVRNLALAARLSLAAFIVFAISLAVPALAADTIEGQVLGAGAPIAKSTVTLWSASADAPKQLAQTQSGDDGHFTLSAEGSPDSILYIVAKGGVPAANKGGGNNPAIALLAVIGNKPPANVVINEFTTVASVWTNAQFLDGDRTQRQRARSAHRGRQRAQFRRSRDRRLRRNDSGRLQQH